MGKSSNLGIKFGNNKFSKRTSEMALRGGIKLLLLRPPNKKHRLRQGWTCRLNQPIIFPTQRCQGIWSRVQEDMIRHSSLLLLPGPPHCHSPLLNVAHSARAQSRKVDQAGPAWEWRNWEAWCVWILKPNRPTPFIHIFVSCVSCFVSNHPIFWVIYRSIFAECILASHIQEQMAPGFRYLNEESRWVGAFQLPVQILENLLAI